MLFVSVRARSASARALSAFASTGKTKQSHKDECDVNRIMARYMQTGVIDFVNKHAPQYGDVTARDYTSAMNQVAAAQSMFYDLPSAIRNRFENNPALLLDFVQNPANKAEAHALGLMRPDYDPNPPAQSTPLPGVSQPEKPAEGGTAKA